MLDPNLPADYSGQHIDDDPIEEKEEPVDMDDNSDEIDLPTTHEEVLQNLQHNKIDQNFLEREAHAKGIDFDQDEPDQFNRTNEE